jgi:hypothetical protein
MTREKQLAAARAGLDYLQKFRQGIAVCMEGPAKAEVLAGFDATIANAQALIARLEHPSAPLSATLPAPTSVQ